MPVKMQKILDDYQRSLKERKKMETGCLRLLRAEIKNNQIQKKEKLNDEEVIQIIRSSLKKEFESLDFFVKGHRDSLAEQTKEEIAVMKRYLPAELSSDEVEKIAQRIISERKFHSIKELGPAMKLVMAEVKGRADGAMVSQIVRKKLE